MYSPQQLKDGTIVNKEEGIARLEEINEEFKSREIESEISSQAELDALKQNGYKLEKSSRKSKISSTDTYGAFSRFRKEFRRRS